MCVYLYGNAPFLYIQMCPHTPPRKESRQVKVVQNWLFKQCLKNVVGQKKGLHWPKSTSETTILHHLCEANLFLMVPRPTSKQKKRKIDHSKTCLVTVFPWGLAWMRANTTKQTRHPHISSLHTHIHSHTSTHIHSSTSSRKLPPQAASQTAKPSGGLLPTTYYLLPTTYYHDHHHDHH